MKRALFSLVCLVGLASALHAQSSAPLVADVPFAFFAGDTAMPAGEYRVWRDPSTQKVRVDPEGGWGVFLSSFGTSVKAPSKKCLLVFNKYSEDRIFLSQIIYAGDSTASEMIKSKRERESVTSTLISGLRPTSVWCLPEFAELTGGVLSLRGESPRFENEPRVSA